jgi:predicted DNA-binding ribbon-helix-helix protein
MYILVDEELGALQKVKKQYETINFESAIAEEFKEIAKRNKVTYSMLLKYLIDKVRECKEAKEQ